ncbi:MAG: sigma-70 family RNA polymerase sigma factor, partial [Deltaproteobacteria bacterium]|nr:sigma-70 family RNA polymerase sigma factor [Deltaproteobacteria bacterium]
MSHTSLHAPSASPLHSYLTEVGSHQLLCRDEEVAIALRLEQARLQICCLLAACPYARAATDALGGLATAGQDEDIGQDGPDFDEAPGAELLGKLDRIAALGAERERLLGAAGRGSDGERERPDAVIGRIDVARRTVLDELADDVEVIEAMARRIRRLAARLDEADAERHAAGRRRARRGLAVPAGLDRRALRALDRDLARARSEAQLARKELVEANLRLVVQQAKRFAAAGAPLLDLVQEGNLGLMRAADKFNPRLGYKFSTYASWWIRQAISRALPEQVRTIRLPVHAEELRRRMVRARRGLGQQLGRDPAIEEIAVELGATPEKLRDLAHAAQDVLSLDAPAGPEQER